MKVLNLVHKQSETMLIKTFYTFYKHLVNVKKSMAKKERFRNKIE